MAKESAGYAYGRVGFLGNPSDIYGGKCLSFTFDKIAEVKMRDASGLCIRRENCSSAHTLEDMGKDDEHRLVKATLRKLGIQEGFCLDYGSEVPYGSGLAGSTALVIATLKAAKDHYQIAMDRYEMAELALRVEIEELGIAAGFQDRYVIAFGGVCFMDFSGKEYIRKDDPYGFVEQLPVSEIPFFLSLGVKPKSSAQVHNSLRERFLRGGLEAQRIKEGMDRIADLALEGKEYLLRGKWDAVGKLMNKNTELREEFCPHLDLDRKMIRRALNLGALGAKVAGSGGAVVILSEERSVFEEMKQDYPVYQPRISRYEEKR